MKQQPHRACEWTKSNQNKKTKVTSYSNWPRALLFDLAHKQWNGIIKGWLHYLTSESKGRFIANNILLAWCLVIAQIQFSLIKKNKGWTCRTARPHTSNNISFLPHLRPPTTLLKLDVICVSVLRKKF